jgi:hypothetical protein
MSGMSETAKDSQSLYEMAVQNAREIHRIMTTDPWLHYLSARKAYDAAKDEADVAYTLAMEEAYKILRESVGRVQAERIHKNVERNGKRSGKQPE